VDNSEATPKLGDVRIGDYYSERQYPSATLFDEWIGKLGLTDYAQEIVTPMNCGGGRLSVVVLS
jgi:hypothetical protein